ncbi:hypothetical protein [Noviherbaspirillum soli]|uniref:hypothetical protein n=1 Tax=Noviherbaspirillum soli TaxID=1064518 RepID=UPI001889D941|nr:hypothetical protein [Noviherbaspirillum soli]
MVMDIVSPKMNEGGYCAKNRPASLDDVHGACAAPLMRRGFRGSGEGLHASIRPVLEMLLSWPGFWALWLFQE